METCTSWLMELDNTLNLKFHVTPRIYHNAKMMLKLYNRVLWRLNSRLDELDKECMEVRHKKLNDALNELLEIDSDLQSINIEKQLQSIFVSKGIIDLIDRALTMLRTYPDGGELYFDIINKVYILHYRFSEQELMESLNIARSTYYKLKKRGIELLGVILWGFILPEILNA